MPTSAPKPCRAPGCRDYGAPDYCAAHRDRATGWKYRKQRGEWNASDPAWRRVRLAKLRANPWCELRIKCPRGGALATEVHHIKPVAQYPALRLEWTNLQSVCVDCHKHMTARARNEARPVVIVAPPEQREVLIG